MSCRLVACSVSTVLCAVFCHSCLALVVSDGDFGDHWVVDGVGSGNRYYLNVENRSDGGNPGAYRFTDQTISDQNILTKDYLVAHLYSLASFNPAIEPFQQISVSFDASAELIDSSYNWVQFGVVLQQDGYLFHHDPGQAGYITTLELNTWRHFDFQGLREDDFMLSDRLPNGVPGPELDLSPTGSPVLIGYYAYVIKSHPNLFIAQAVTCVDNFSANFSPVPEPGIMGLGLSVVLVAMARRLRPLAAASPLG